MSRVFKRCCKGEQSLVREEGVRPLASFDAVTQRRHHAIRPDRSFRPPPSPRLSAGDVSPLRSLGGTGGVIFLPTPTPTSTLLPPLPPSRVSFPPPRPPKARTITNRPPPHPLPRTSALSPYS